MTAIAIVIGLLSAISPMAILNGCIRLIYHLFNPAAKAKYEAKQKEIEKQKLQEEQTKNAERMAREEAKKEKERVRIDSEQKEIREQKEQRKHHRDSEKQETPYVYLVGRHANEALAIRYGIANYEKNGKHNKQSEYPANTIAIQKTRRIAPDKYEALLTDYRDRKAIAIIEQGTEYIKTFYPLDENWFQKHADLELTLKGNGSFTLKELATFHIQKTI